MRLFSRRNRGDDVREGRSLAEDAIAMRSALDAMQGQERIARGAAGSIDLRALVTDMLEGEIAAPTPDVEWLVRHDTDPREFYEKEIAPSWEGLDEDARAARLEGFIDLARSVDTDPEGAGLPEEMVATVRTKALVLAWAFDESYGYMTRIAAGAYEARPAAS
jgi:hypothetical protein